MAAKSVAFHTLGCKLNFSETSSLAHSLEQGGFVRRDFEDDADIFVINTCSVTENADKECRYLVRGIRRRAPQAHIVITGCYAQLKPHEIAAIEGVDLVLGAAEKFNLPLHLEALSADPTYGKVHSCEIAEVTDFHSSSSGADRTRAFLKVQDGCDYSCSFCTIPMARGASRSDRIENVLANVRELETAGVKEIVITGINLGDFGAVPAGQLRDENFEDLVHALETKTTVPRIRFSSVEPNLLTDQIITLVAGSDRLMPHFHIPLQSGSDRVLGKMRRRYRSALYEDRVQKIKSLMPHASIGADVIVGFPGESDADFEETFALLHRLPVSYLHVFTYSERPGTLAAEMESVVPMQARNERNRILRNLSYQKLQYFTAQYQGQARKVLFERAPKGTMMEGYSDNYIKVQVPYQAHLANEVVDWRL